MKCKGCNTDIEGDRYKPVGDWVFCDTCFEDLMETAETRSPEPAKNDEEEQAALQKISIPLQCALCNISVEPGSVKKVGILNVCEPCYQELIFRPKPKPVAEPDTEDEIPEQNQKEDYQEEKIDLNKTTPCHGCGKTIRVIASKEFEDNHFCPDCYYTTILPKKQKTSDDIAGTMVCDSCGKTITNDDSVKTIEGFNICQLCNSTDPELAVEMAKEKHRKRMMGES